MTTVRDSAFFVTTDQLAQSLGALDLAVIDGTFFMPDEGRDAKAEYLAGHIPGAVFFDIDAIADHTTGLPHMLPEPDAFCEAVEKLGLGDGMRFVVYDASGLQGAPRVWWTLRTFGAADVKILDGGLPRWTAEGRALEQGPVNRRAARRFTSRFDAAAVADASKVKAASETGAAQIVDARAAARFAGAAAEPRPGLRSGHIPTSLNVPWREVVDNGTLKGVDEVAAAFTTAGVNIGEPIITTCGSGVTAAILLLALASIGKQDVALYDGSWSEWGARDDLPIATGGARG
jgi:thiosulfate/3-mercaptopyruvate sulfurtransferase